MAPMFARWSTALGLTMMMIEDISTFHVIIEKERNAVYSQSVFSHPIQLSACYVRVATSPTCFHERRPNATNAIHSIHLVKVSGALLMLGT